MKRLSNKIGIVLSCTQFSIMVGNSQCNPLKVLPLDRVDGKVGGERDGKKIFELK
jgi:hypothetical protein